MLRRAHLAARRRTGEQKQVANLRIRVIDDPVANLAHVPEAGLAMDGLHLVAELQTDDVLVVLSRLFEVGDEAFKIRYLVGVRHVDQRQAADLDHRPSRVAAVALVVGGVEPAVDEVCDVQLAAAAVVVRAVACERVRLVRLPSFVTLVASDVLGHKRKHNERSQHAQTQAARAFVAASQ